MEWVWNLLKLVGLIPIFLKRHINQTIKLGIKLIPHSHTHQPNTSSYFEILLYLNDTDIQVYSEITRLVWLYKNLQKIVCFGENVVFWTFLRNG